MTYDDDPYNEDNSRAKWISLAAVIVFCLATFALLAWFASTKVKAQDYQRDQDYLPPQRYRNIPAQQPQAAEQDEPMEYYAQDWIVKDQAGRVMCKDPYVRKDLKIVECIGHERIR